MFANLAKVYATDKNAFEDGVWIDIGNGSKIKVRSPQSAHAKAVRKKLEAPYTALIRTGKELPEDVTEKMVVAQMSQSLIIDWDGPLFEDDKGTKITASPENIAAALAFQSFRDDAGSVIASRDTFKAHGLETDTGK